MFGQSLPPHPPPMGPHHPELDRNEDQCLEELGITKPNFAEGKFPSFEEMKCMMKCKMIKSGIMRETGDLNLDTLRRHFNPNNDTTKEELISKCVTIVEDDVCKKAFAISKCLMVNFIIV